jgi:hypothetical protein
VENFASRPEPEPVTIKPRRRVGEIITPSASVKVTNPKASDA